MQRLYGTTFRRPDDMSDRTDPAVLYVRSYLLIRTIVGVFGILLPLILIIGEAYFLRGSVQLRGSLSGYYHTPMRDIFVASLCVTGFLLATYLAGQVNTWDFWLSLVAGVAVIGVAFFPTARPDLSGSEPRCGTTPIPDGCTPIQQHFGEVLVGRIHFTLAAVFVLSLAAIAFVFAYRAREYAHDTGLATFQKACGWIIILAIAWVVVANVLDIRTTPAPLYLGEIIATWAFGASWLVKGRSLEAVLIPRRRPRTLAAVPNPQET